jgi:hypothetical protein
MFDLESLSLLTPLSQREEEEKEFNPNDQVLITVVSREVGGGGGGGGGRQLTLRVHMTNDCFDRRLSVRVSLSPPRPFVLSYPNRYYHARGKEVATVHI